MNKICSAILIITFFISLSGQEFKLIEPNSFKLKKQLSNNNDSEVIFLYLLNNYKSTSKKYQIKYFEWDATKTCGFKQKFNSGITYSVFECKEAGGITINLELPKIKRKELMNWIEKINEIGTSEPNQNIWKEKNSKFEPKEVESGCYYKIIEKEKTTLVELYCGC